ncbi:MAG: tetratricopeptide repeat protein [Gammaproteobacteria bacterium]|nr:tetratricopeptide repeat protein [Gammaproteobacteria bacterium]
MAPIAWVAVCSRVSGGGHRLRRRAATHLVLMALLAVAVGCNDQEARSGQDLIQHVQDLQISGRFEESMDPLRDLLLDEPAHIDARLMLARAYLELQDGATADSHIRRAVKLGATPDSVRAMRVHALVLKKAYGEAIALLRPGDTENGDINLLLPAAQAHLGHRQLVQARALFRIVLQAGSHDAAAHTGLFEIAMIEGDYEAAETQLAALAKNLDSTRHLEGRIALARNQPQRAAEAYQRLIARNPADTTASVGLVQARLALGEQAAARRVLEQLLADDPESADAHYLLAVAEYLDGNTKASLDQVRETLSHAPHYGPALRLFGMLNLRLGYSEQAVEALKRYLSGAQEDLETRKLLVAVLLQLKHTYEADDLLREVSELRDDPTLVTLRGLSHLQHGDYVTAIELLKQVAAVHAEPDAPAAVAGDLYAEAGITADPWRPDAAAALISERTGLEGTERLSQLITIDSGLTGDEETGLVLRLVEDHEATKDYLALAKHAAEQGDLVEACALYARMLTRAEHDEARQRFRALECEEKYGSIETQQARAPGDTRFEPSSGPLAPPPQKAQMSRLVHRLRASLDKVPAAGSEETRPPGDTSPPRSRANAELLASSLSTELLAHMVSTQIAVVGHTALSGVQSTYPLHLIPPDLKEQLKEMRDRLPTWVRALDDGPEGTAAGPSGGDPAAGGGSQFVADTITTITPESGETTGGFRWLVAVFDGGSELIGWLGDTMRNNEALLFIFAIPVILALFLRDVLGNRRRGGARRSHRSHRHRVQADPAPQPPKAETKKKSTSHRHRRRRYSTPRT